MKRKVLIIVENAPAPFDPRVWKEAVALRADGYEVTILCPRAKGYEEAYEFREGIHIYRHPMPRERDGVSGYLIEYGCALFWEFLYSWWIFCRRGFHALQACNPPDDIFLVALPFKIFGVKFVFDHHDVNPELYLAKYERKGSLYRLLTWLEKLTFRTCDVAISTNDSYKEIAITRGGLSSDNVFVVRNGPDLNAFRPTAPDPALRHGKRYLIGYVGTMGTQDGLDILLNVAERIKQLGRRDIHFTCVGTGPAFRELQEIVRVKNLADMVTFTGRISDKDLLAILSTADICVNPDKPCRMNDISTMIKIMEYMAMGKPIVQFDLKEGRISAGEASLYCDRENQVVDFADKILWLLDHPEQRKRMGDAGRMRVETKLAWEYSVENLLAAYARVFGETRADNKRAPVLATGSHEPPHDEQIFAKMNSSPPDFDDTNQLSSNERKIGMSTLEVPSQAVETVAPDASLEQTITRMIDDMIGALPDPRQLTSKERRGIIARYTAVLEGNFIYWMTATLIATKSDDARPILLDNLHEEVRDAHPHMMRKFAIAAHAFPTDQDALAVHDDLTKMRLFLGRLSAVQSLLAMAFFEGFIQKFMPFLASLAAAEGSAEMEYTDVHGVCDIAHTAGLFRALATEMATNPPEAGTDVFEGVHLLRTLMELIVYYQPEAASV